MITGLHAMFYSSDAEGARAFLRDKLQLSYTEIGHGWLIFNLPEVEMGCHPAEKENGRVVPSGTHEFSLFCDDVHATVAELKSRGVEFTEEVTDVGYGLATYFKMPGDITVQLYQPRYERKASGKEHSS